MPTPEERRAERKARLGWTLARLRKLTLHAEGSPLIENDMKSVLHQVIDINPADLIDVIENFQTYVEALEEQHAEWRAEDAERTRNE